MPIRQIKVRFVILVLRFGLRRKRQPIFKKRSSGFDDFGCRKRFLCPEAVLMYREWAKKRLEAQYTLYII